MRVKNTFYDNIYRKKRMDISALTFVLAALLIH